MAKKRINRETNLETGIVQFTDMTSGDKLECDVKVLFPAYANFSEIQRRLVLHSVNAKVGDSAADPNKGDAVSLMKGTWATLVDGKWSVRGDGVGGPRGSDLASAVFNVMKAGGADVTEEQVIEAVAGWTDEKKAEYRSKPKIKAEIERLRKQRQDERTKAALKAAKESDDKIEL